jgi:two-component system OmpR family response regulator
VSIPEAPLVTPESSADPPFRVLCVDDNRDIADSTALLLQTVGFETWACYDGPSALRLVEVVRPSICFLDLHMPGMDGDVVALRLREWAAGRPLVLVALTAMSGSEYRERISAAGFDHHLVKPVDPFKLVQVVDQLFRSWSAQGAARMASQ